MLARTGLDPQEALVCTMVLVAAAESGGITDREIGVMATLVQTLPVFEGFSGSQLQHAADCHHPASARGRRPGPCRAPDPRGAGAPPA